MRRTSAVVVRVILLLASALLSMQSARAGDSDVVTPQHEVRSLVEAARQLPVHDPEKERLYRAALKLSPSDPQVLFNLALLLQANGEYTEAARRYQEVLQQDPADALAHYNLANVLLAADNPGSWQRSAWHFRRFMFYTDHGTRFDKAEAALSNLESNLAALYAPYRDKRYSRDQLTDRLSRIEPADTVRGSSKYDGPRLPLMLNFAVQSAALTPAAKQQLDDVAAVLALPALRQDRVQIEGYTDSHENSEFEVRLRYARQRADAVRQYLLQAHKLDAGRFTVKAFADLEIISPNNTPEGRAANRRVELYNLSRGSKVAAPLYTN